MPARSFARCPNCGSTAIYLNGVVGHRQVYDGLKAELGPSTVFWEFSYPRSGDCATCGADVTEYLVELGVLKELYDVVRMQKRER